MPSTQSLLYRTGSSFREYCCCLISRRWRVFLFYRCTMHSRRPVLDARTTFSSCCGCCRCRLGSIQALRKIVGSYCLLCLGSTRLCPWWRFHFFLGPTLVLFRVPNVGYLPVDTMPLSLLFCVPSNDTIHHLPRIEFKTGAPPPSVNLICERLESCFACSLIFLRSSHTPYLCRCLCRLVCSLFSSSLSLAPVPFRCSVGPRYPPRARERAPRPRATRYNKQRP